MTQGIVPPLLAMDSIDEVPVDYLRRVGEVFVEFGSRTQDSGNISYGVQIDDERFFVKTAGDPGDTVHVLDFEARVGLLRNAARLAETFAHAATPRLLRVIESPVGPMLVYAWADGERLGGPSATRSDPASALQRFHALPAEAVARGLDTLYELHRDLARAGWIAVDLYDGSLLYDFSASRLSVMDLDSYHQGPFVNEMGRMFGSTRFMAPEEFERGALIDERTSVFVLGRFAAVFLGDGTLAPEAFRGTPEMLDVVARACEPDPAERFGSMEVFHDAWRAARSV